MDISLLIYARKKYKGSSDGLRACDSSLNTALVPIHGDGIAAGGDFSDDAAAGGLIV